MTSENSMATCEHPADRRQNLHHNGLPVELCRACGHSRWYQPAMPPAAGGWGEWTPGLYGTPAGLLIAR